MTTQQIFIGRDADGNPLLLEGTSILMENGDELALSPRTTAGWQWKLRFLPLNEIDQSQLADAEKHILIGGSLFEESTYQSSSDDGDVPEAMSAADADAELLNEDLGIELRQDGAGLFTEGLFLYEVSVGNGTTILGRVRRRRPI